MKGIEKRITDLEGRIQSDTQKPWLLFLPDTTFEQAKEEFEKQTGNVVTNEEFKQALPLIGKVIFSFHSGDGSISCNEWIEQYVETGT